MRKLVALWICVLLLAAGLFRAAQAALNGSTYLPLVFHDPTHTPTITPTPTRTPTITPTSRPPFVEIDAIEAAGQLHERIIIINNTGRAVNMTGWRLKAETGELYRFPNYTLPAFDGNKDGNVTVYTHLPGEDFLNTLHWGLDGPLFDIPSACVQLSDEDGDLVDRFCLND